MPETLATLRARADALVSAGVRAALEQSGWVVAAAARALDALPTQVYRVIRSDPKLARDLERHAAKKAAGLAGDTQKIRQREKPPKGTAH